MELRELLKQLFDKGYSQKQIAEFAGCSQPTIGDLANGNQKTTRFDIGMKIVELHRKVVQSEPQAEKEAA